MGDGMKRAVAAAKATREKRPLNLLPILISCVGGAETPGALTLLTCWALERRIASLTGREAPRDAHVVLNAFEGRERELRAELEALQR